MTRFQVGPNTRLLMTSVVAATAGCGGSQTSEPAPAPSAIEAAEPMAVEPVAVEAPPPEPPPAVTVTAGERSPIEGRAPTLRIRAPRSNQTIRRGDVMLRLQLRDWELGPAPGSHVHVIVDNEPYIAVRDVSAPINLNELYRNTFERELSEGTHVVRAFPSRHHHESVKEGTPFALVVFHYRQATDGFDFDADAPLLTYSRPKGCVVAAEPALLDFYLANVEGLAADGVRVHYRIGETEGDLTTWAPHSIANLPVGEVPVQLTLVGPEGPIAGPFNDTSRTIRVAESCE